MKNILCLLGIHKTDGWRDTEETLGDVRAGWKQCSRCGCCWYIVGWMGIGDCFRLNIIKYQNAKSMKEAHPMAGWDNFRVQPR